MKLLLTNITIFYLFIWYLPSVYAQKDFVAAGGEARGAGGRSSFSIGQIYFSDIINNNGSVAQGVQQPYEIFILKGEDEKGIQLSFSIYPIPATGFITLKVDKGKIENLTYVVNDDLGRIIIQKKLVDVETRITLTKLDNKVFFVRVLKNNLEIKCFKVLSLK